MRDNKKSITISLPLANIEANSGSFTGINYPAYPPPPLPSFPSPTVETADLYCAFCFSFM